MINNSQSPSAHLMRVEPVHASVGSFFGHKPMYRVPKYQRGYAWDDTEIDDFLQDLELCFKKRKAGNPINHFFGGIVSVINSVPGVVNQSEFELVDGQQRMATFVLLMASVINVYKELLLEAISINDEKNKKIINNRIAELSLRYIEFEQETNRDINTVEVFILSKADQQFFRDIIRLANPTQSRDSHRKIESAYNKITDRIRVLTGTNDLVSKIDNLEVFNDIIDGDFSLIHIKTFNKKEAYTLFRVLNDRGKSLTDGDLLRARILELLEPHSSQQASVESLWDEILSDSPRVTEEYLRWIYASYAGVRAGANTLFDDFLSQFYPQNSNAAISTINANEILTTTRNVHKDILNCRKITNGIWPYQLTSPITLWDANRLTLLIKDLRLTLAMPLLLAACNLDQRQFSTIVQMFERFMFRFKVIGNQHVTPVVNIIHNQSTQIRTNLATYSTNTLESALNALQMDKVPDTLFRSLLENLNYKEGGSNQPIKYFLITVEHYLRWYEAGAAGNPVCMDKTRIYDFSSTTIEHVYPRNAPLTNRDAMLEPLKNSLGNLTIMGPSDNVLGSNDNFIIKKPIFEDSSVKMNQIIGRNIHWSETEVVTRANQLKDVACAVFNI
ncbi:DUF262 domain-containing protein [Pontibacter anaerobius]|uniref:DUF262 domain-containing protein n=1 Tax=Pontibacter anaerobius TaxID=2993940 RepID=A0ABT3RJ48_9BACT|nr:DUF262 domain-containing protein [Pontibacter anaerobius]MCX2741456.1 DUF262 domain-containing protein [Pontibacter anaerobius]